MRRSRWKRARSTAILVLVVGLHLGLLLLAGRGLGARLTQWGRPGGGGQMSVSLVGASALRSTAGAEPSPAPDPPVVPTSLLSEPDVATLLPSPTAADASAPVQAQPMQAAATQAGSLGEAGAQGVASENPVAFDRDPYAHASLMTKADPRAVETARLQLQISRCWTEDASTPPVRLSVILDAQGALVGTPAPVRTSDAAQNTVTATMEAAAIKAVQDCAPYALLSADASGRGREVLVGPMLNPTVASAAVR